MTGSLKRAPAAVSCEGTAAGADHTRADAREGKPAAGPARHPEGDRLEPRVLGIDLSLTATGLVLHDASPLTITPGKGLHGVARLREIRGAIMSVAVPSTDLAVIEGPAYSRQLGAGHHEAAGLWWVIAYMLTMHDIPFAIIPPTTLKKYAVGKGTATKADMRVALLQRTGLDVRDDNQVDAWWLRCAGLDHLGRPPVAMPATHRAALEKVIWPEVPCAE